MDKILHANLRDIERVFMVSVCEGNGLTSAPYRIIQYIVTENAVIIGKVDPNWEKVTPLKP